VYASASNNSTDEYRHVQLSTVHMKTNEK